jgi:dGTPase
VTGPAAKTAFGPDLAAFERSILAPYAMRSSASRGRRHAEPEHPFRLAFQRDRDRIIHCSAFRRLEYKTQVFVNHEGDYYRTRLTHTMEAAQITRTVARALSLNEDLAEAVALAHDLGHTPFGHAGEWALNALMAPHGGFDHNAQSLRIVDVLEERYPHFAGLNLTWEVREGIVKHSGRYDRPQAQEFDPRLAPCLEAQLVDFADEIAYNAHDIDDGLESGMLRLEDLRGVSLWEESLEATRGRYPDIEFPLRRYAAVRYLIDMLVTDLATWVRDQIRAHDITSVEAVRAHCPRLVDFSPPMRTRNQELKGALKEHLYTHYRVTRMGMKAQKVITGLFEAYMAEPRQMPPQRSSAGSGGPPARMVADYIAGLTDRSALDEYRKLYDPLERV